MKSHNIGIMPMTKKLEKSICGSANVDNKFQAKYQNLITAFEDFDYVRLDTRLRYSIPGGTLRHN